MMGPFSHRFDIDKNSLQIQTKGDSYEVTFNKTQTFSELYTQAKTRQEFKEDDG